MSAGTTRHSERWRADRVSEDRVPAAGRKSTLNRLELAAAGGDETKARKIVADVRLMDELLVGLFVESYAAETAEVTLDLGATGIRLHGSQEGRFYHA